MPNFDKDDDTLLARWLEGTLSEAELKKLEQHPDFLAYQRIIAATDRLTVPDAQVAEMWKKWMPPQPTPSKKRLLLPLVIGLLVVAAVAIVAYLMWPTKPSPPPPAPMAIKSGIGEQKEVVLPDGSLVRMNAVSSIRFDSVSWATQRIVQLSGEAWFDVKKSNVPFKIETTLGSVIVLGTIFTVRQREQVFEVACFSGRVKTESQGKSAIVESGQRTALQNGNWEALKSLQHNDPDWSKEESRFDGAPLRAVLDELERYYEVRVTTASGLDQRVFSGAFVHNNLPLALRLICEPLGLTPQVNGKNIHILPK
jgi:transmembrane sensor